MEVHHDLIRLELALGQANSLTQVNCRVRGPGERTWMLHLDTARRAAIQNCGAEKSSINCSMQAARQLDFLRSGNYGRVQRFESSLVGNQEGFWNASSSQVLVFKWGKIIGLTLILNLQVCKLFYSSDYQSCSQTHTISSSYREWGAIALWKFTLKLEDKECLLRSLLAATLDKSKFPFILSKEENSLLSVW